MRIKIIIIEWPSYYMHKPHRVCIQILGKVLIAFEVV